MENVSYGALDVGIKLSKTAADRRMLET